MRGAWGWMLAVASAACGGAPAKAPAAHGSTPAPFFPPGTDLHWLYPQADPNPYAPTVTAPPKTLAPDVITRESVGSAPAVCRFDRPLDDMDFGQLHCNARCAAATAP